MDYCIRQLTSDDYRNFRKAYSRIIYSFSEKGKGNPAWTINTKILEAVNNGINVYYAPNINAGTLHPYLEGSNQVSYFHSNYIDNSRVVATGFLIDSNKNITVSNYSALDNYYTKTEVNELHSSLEEYVNSQAEDSVKKYFLIIETTKEGNNYLLDGITFNEIYEKFNVGNVNMVCHVDETDYIPLLSVTSTRIIFSGIYDTTSVSLVFNTQGIGTLTTTHLTENSNLQRYYTKTETDEQIANLVNSAPETLDTLGELATALQENATVVEALDASITNKQDKISDTLILVDTVTGIQHKIQIQNGQLVSFPVNET